MKDLRAVHHRGSFGFDADEPTRPDLCWPEALMATGDPLALFQGTLAKVQLKCHELRDSLEDGHQLDIELAAYGLVTACLVLAALTQVLRLTLPTRRRKMKPLCSQWMAPAKPSCGCSGAAWRRQRFHQAPGCTACSSACAARPSAC